jgi:hypothetical protein
VAVAAAGGGGEASWPAGAHLLPQPPLNLLPQLRPEEPGVHLQLLAQLYQIKHGAATVCLLRGPPSAHRPLLLLSDVPSCLRYKRSCRKGDRRWCWLLRCLTGLKAAICEI